MATGSHLWTLHRHLDVWILRDCEVAEMEVRTTRSLAGMGIDFDGDGRGGKSQGHLA